MNLDEYLKAIEQCPDEGKNDKWRLSSEFGIYDNWPILLKANYEELIKDLIASGKNKNLFNGGFEISDTRTSSNHITKYFNYIPGTVQLQVGNWIFGCNLVYDEPELVHQKRQETDYNVSMLLHPYYKKKMEGVVHWTRAIAIVAAEIGRYAQKKDIPLCFPNSRGWDCLKDYSKIVYYEPGVEAQEK